VSESQAPIVIAYDGSDHSGAAVTAAARLFPGRPAVVVTAWRTVADAVQASVIAIPASVAHEAQVKMDAAARDEAQALADEGATKAGDAGLHARAEAIEAHGAVWPAIVHAGDQHDAAAIVVGSRGRSPFKSALLGSTSAGVLHHSRRPVLVVHVPDDPETSG
jgi:nucleotide-binding universal stress UspA family protein